MKKHFLSFLLATVTLLFAGCIETTEELTISADGSGTYHVGMDMSGLLDMMDMLKAMDTAATDGKKEKAMMDTTLQMRHFSDTASHLSAEEKTLLQPAQMRLLMNEDARQFKINMNFPFARISDVEKLMKISHDGDGGNVMTNIFKSSSIGGTEAGNDKMPDINSYYDTKVTANIIERRLNKEKYQALQQNEQAKGMQQAGDMLESFKINTVIHLPRPAKSITGSRAQLSADKKILTIKATLMDLFETPDALSYRVEY